MVSKRTTKVITENSTHTHARNPRFLLEKRRRGREIGGGVSRRVSRQWGARDVSGRVLIRYRGVPNLVQMHKVRLEAFHRVRYSGTGVRYKGHVP